MVCNRTPRPRTPAVVEAAQLLQAATAHHVCGRQIIIHVHAPVTAAFLAFAGGCAAATPPARLIPSQVPGCLDASAPLSLRRLSRYPTILARSADELEAQLAGLAELLDCSLQRAARLAFKVPALAAAGNDELRAHVDLLAEVRRGRRKERVTGRGRERGGRDSRVHVPGVCRLRCGTCFVLPPPLPTSIHPKTHPPPSSPIPQTATCRTHTPSPPIAPHHYANLLFD